MALAWNRKDKGEGSPSTLDQHEPDPVATTVEVNPRRKIQRGVIFLIIAVLTLGVAWYGSVGEARREANIKVQKHIDQTNDDTPSNLQQKTQVSVNGLSKIIDKQETDASTISKNRSASDSASSSPSGNTYQQNVNNNDTGGNSGTSSASRFNSGSVSGSMQNVPYSASSGDRLPPPPPAPGTAFKPTPITSTEAAQGNDAIRLGGGGLIALTGSGDTSSAPASQNNSVNANAFGLVDLKGGSYP